MKRIFNIIILFILVVATVCLLSGCGKSDEVVVVEYLINQIGTVTLDSKESIDDAKEAYEKLSDSDKKVVKNYEILTSAQTEFDKLEKEQKELEAKRLAEEQEKKEAEKKKRAEAAKVDPAPISMSKMRLGTNMIGTPEVYVQFTNNSKKTLEAFDFLVRCYNKYGEIVKGYGVYERSQCYYDTNLPSGSTTSSDWRWTLYGFDGVSSFKVAISKYKLQGETAVEIPENQLKWK